MPKLAKAVIKFHLMSIFNFQFKSNPFPTRLKNPPSRAFWTSATNDLHDVSMSLINEHSVNTFQRRVGQKCHPLYFSCRVCG